MKNKIEVNNKGQVTLEAIIVVPLLMIFLLLFLNFSLRIYNKSMGLLLMEDRTRTVAMESYWNNSDQLVDVINSCETDVKKGLSALTKGVSSESIKTTYSMDFLGTIMTTKADLKIASDLLGNSSHMKLESSMDLRRPLQELDRIMTLKYILDKLL